MEHEKVCEGYCPNCGTVRTDDFPVEEYDGVYTYNCDNCGTSYLEVYAYSYTLWETED